MIHTNFSLRTATEHELARLNALPHRTADEETLRALEQVPPGPDPCDYARAWALLELVDGEPDGEDEERVFDARVKRAVPQVQFFREMERERGRELERAEQEGTRAGGPTTPDLYDPSGRIPGPDEWPAELRYAHPRDRGLNDPRRSRLLALAVVCFSVAALLWAWWPR